MRIMKYNLMKDKNGDMEMNIGKKNLVHALLYLFMSLVASYGDQLVRTKPFSPFFRSAVFSCCAPGSWNRLYLLRLSHRKNRYMWKL